MQGVGSSPSHSQWEIGLCCAHRRHEARGNHSIVIPSPRAWSRDVDAQLKDTKAKKIQANQQFLMVQRNQEKVMGSDGCLYHAQALYRQLDDAVRSGKPLVSQVPNQPLERVERWFPHPRINSDVQQSTDTYSSTYTEEINDLLLTMRQSTNRPASSQGI